MRKVRVKLLIFVAVAAASVAGCAAQGSVRPVDHTMPGPDRGANPAPGDNPARAVNPGTAGDNGDKP